MERIEVNGNYYKLNKRYKKPFDDFIDEFRETQTNKKRRAVRYI